MEMTGPPPQGDYSKGPAMIIFDVVTVSVATIVVAIRFAVRIWISKCLGWDDWTILAAALGNFIGGALDLVEIHYGFGRSMFYLNKHQLLEFGKYVYGEWIQTFATLMFTKVSICLFLLRIPVTKVLIRPLQAAIAFLVVSNVVLTLMWIFQCTPVDAAWNSEIQSTSRCFSRGELQRIIMAQALISIISDFLFAAYPVFMLWSVQMKFQTKLSLWVLMGLGVITASCCIVRTVLNNESIPIDKTYGGGTNWFWRTFEVEIGIIAACAPAIRPGYVWLYPKITSSFRSSKGPSKLSDEVRLKQFKGEPVVHQDQGYSWGTGGNDVSDDAEWGAPVSPYDQIRKTTDVDIEQGPPTGAHAGEQVKF